MINKLVRMLILFSVIAVGGMVTAVMIAICCGNNNAGEPNQTAQKTEVPQPNDPPIIIWYHHVYKDRPIALRTALYSGLITHAMIKDVHRKDIHYKNDADVLEALKIAKSFDVKLIWSRPLWPGYGIEQSSTEDLFDPNYYIQEIKILRAEANEVGVDFVALDTEAYAHAPVGKYLRHKHGLNTKQREKLKLTIGKVIKAVGKVDFVYPGGSIYSQHPANTLGRLGKYRISGYFYYGNEERRKSMRFPYHIVGIHVNTTRENKKHQQLPYYYVSEVFTQSHLWSGKKGVFIYPHDRKGLAIAKELVAYSRKLPFKASQQQKRPDSAPK